MAIAMPFLLRTHGSFEEYLFFPAESYDLNLLNQNLIAPSIPGKTSVDIEGSGSTNFEVDLGSWQLVFRITGTLAEVAKADYPSLSSTSRNFILHSGAFLSADTQNGKEIRHALINFIADQSDSSYSDFKFGWPDWGADISQRSFASTSYRLYEGYVRGFNCREVSGEPNVFSYSFEFVVGDTL